jgi:hypothetical protein
MTAWKWILGACAACAACCAAPLAAGVAAGSALFACADELAPSAAALAGLGLAVAATAWWRRRARRRPAASTSCDGCCDVRRA